MAETRRGADQDQIPLPALDSTVAREDTWHPTPGTDLEDGRIMHETLFVGGDIRHLRAFMSASTGLVVDGALRAVEARLASAVEGDVLRVLDYGAGTGLAAIEFLRACRERGIERRLELCGARLELHLVDLPNPWFAQGYDLLRDCAWTRFHSLAAPNGGFRPLLEAVGGRRMDALMSANVFHLIPPRALARAAADLASAVKPGGSLTWSSPDLAPAGPSAVLFHDPNRMLRRHWLEALADPSLARPGERGPAPHRPAVAEAVAHVRGTLDADALSQAQRRADRHILPQPTAATAVVGALEPHFTGDLLRPRFEMPDRETLAALLVPSNQREYLPEIGDGDLRERVIKELMTQTVLPELEAYGARTADGLEIQWSIGAFVRREGH
jgi:hypothetical protein